jgi:hypothetical protein
VPNCEGGGVPSSFLFYKNPQFLIYVDQTKLTNKANAKNEFEFLASFSATDPESTVKMFLCHANKGNKRVSTIND